MHEHTTTVERAFELARSGQFGTIKDVCQRLEQEGYSAKQIEGPILEDQIRELIRGAAARSAIRSSVSE
jgi:hypothetical protein